MKTEKENCCFCFNIASGGNIINLDTLDLLKFLIGNVNTSALENSTVCDGCLNKIVESCDYKRRNSSKMLMEAKQKVDSEKPIMCQKCEKVCEQGDTFSLVNCVRQIDWPDFVNYLFVDQDTQSLESLQICDSCRISVSNIQDFLKLIYIYDESKMKCDIDYFDDIKATENKNLVEDKIEIKNELENFVVDDKTVIENIEGYKTEMDDIDYINYADLKCKNEEVDMKLDDDDDNQSTDQYEKVDVESEEELGVNFQGCRNNLKAPIDIGNFKCKTSRIYDCDKCSHFTTTKTDMLIHRNHKHGIKIEWPKYECQNCTYETFNKHIFIRHLKIHNIQDFKCILCPKIFFHKRDLDGHLLGVHKSKDNVTSKIYECDKCSYSTTRNYCLSRHKLKHGIGILKTERLNKYKCQFCTYETYDKNSLIQHRLYHKIIYKCTLCSKNFATKDLKNHLLNVHKIRDNRTTGHFECIDLCN